MEKIIKPVSGFLTLLVGLILFVIAIFCFIDGIDEYNGVTPIFWCGPVCLLASIFLFKGLIIINPNQSSVCTFFGKYVGTIKENGLLFVNPLYSKQKLSLRANNFESTKLKVNDKMGNPIEIAAVIVWQVNDTAKALFDVENYIQYVNIQSESAVRHLANSFPYDNYEDEEARITLRDGAEEVSKMLEQELNQRLERAGITVIEARISHLAYSPEIASAMLQRQQASAIIAARRLIVEGAVGIVEMALARLALNNVVELDEERKAAMVSNLLVVLCGDRNVTPVVNTGTLYH